MTVAASRWRLEPLAAGRESVLRQRLLELLRLRFTHPVVVVVAPAGYGKTTALAQALEENRLAPTGLDAWLTCDAADGAASTLAAGLCDALGVGAPAGGEPDHAVAAVVEAIWHRSPEEVALLLDDVHEVPAGSPGAELLGALAAALPRNGHLVLAGRAVPIPLARLDLAGHVLSVDESTLAFTDDELDEFAHRRGVPRDRLAGCAGWPALAELAASAGIDAIDTAYLWEEVLAGITPSRRQDLALLAHVGPFDDDLAATVLGHDVDLASTVADLPLVGQAGDGSRSLHSLWRPLLAREVLPSQIATARRRAGVTLAERGEVARALQLLGQAAAWDDMTTVVTEVLGVARPPVHSDVVAAWSAQLPDDLGGSPLARLLDAVAAVRNRPDAAARRLGEVMLRFREEGELAGELACVAQLAQLAWWWEQPEQMLAVAARLVELEAAGYEPAIPLACLARALVADVANDSTAALAELDRIPPGSFNETWQSLVDWLRSTSLNHLGRPREALAAAERACAHPSPLHAPLIESARLQARWFLGEVDDVLRELPPLVARTEATGLRDYTALMAASCCTALAMAGRPDAAAPFLEQARHVATSRELPLVDVNLAIGHAELAIARGDDDAAAEVLHDYLRRWPLLGAGHAAAPQQRMLTLWYVLVPESREVWDRAPLGPCFQQARDLARRLVAARGSPTRSAGSAGPAGPRGSGGPTRWPSLPDPHVVRAHLPIRWATELALAEIGAGRQDGWTLLEALWPTAQAEVRRRASDAASPLSRPARAALGRLPVPPSAKLELVLLGPVELRRDGVPVDAPEWRRERVRSLLAHLVLHRSVARERLADDLWPDLDADAQSRNLRVTLTHLLRVLEPDRKERDASFLVRSHGSNLVLESGDHLDADVWSFDEHWQRASEADRRGAPSVGLPAMCAAVALWRGEPTELANEPWALTEVEDRRLRLRTMATRAAELLLAKGQSEDARQMVQVALEVDPWSETALRIAAAADRALGHAP